MAQLPKNVNLIILVNLELLGYPALVRQGSLRVRTKGKLHFKLIYLKKLVIATVTFTVHNYPVAWYFKDWLKTGGTFNLSPKIVFLFVMNCYWLTLSYTWPTCCQNINQLWMWRQQLYSHFWKISCKERHNYASQSCKYVTWSFFYY